MKYSNDPNQKVIRHKVEITQVGKWFIVKIDGQPLNREGSTGQASFATSMDAYDAAERRLRKGTI